MKFRYKFILKKRLVKQGKPWMLVSDVDGVLTNGSFAYSLDGKVFKFFGSEDSDALQRLSKNVKIAFVSADFRGFQISQLRVNDMGFGIQLVSSEDRLKMITELRTLYRVIYVGDSFTDIPCLLEADIGIVPNNSFHEVKRKSNVILSRNGGHGAIAELALEIQRILDGGSNAY